MSQLYGKILHIKREKDHLQYNTLLPFLFTWIFAFLVFL